jgi:hypothetical protein
MKPIGQIIMGMELYGKFSNFESLFLDYEVKIVENRNNVFTGEPLIFRSRYFDVLGQKTEIIKRDQYNIHIQSIGIKLKG